MMLRPAGIATLRLKEAEAADCDDLRVWKNANRAHFFFKGEITPEMQAAWFAKLQANPHDTMFMVQESANGKSFINTGCMGWRILAHENTVDVYNIMRGRRVAGSPHSMAEAFGLMNAWLAQTQTLPITCRVLTDNPACGWYKKNAFEATGTGEENGEAYIVYRLNPAKLPPIKVEVL